MGNIRQIRGFRGITDPFFAQTLFYAPFNGSSVALTGQSINTTVGAPVFSGVAPLAFGDGSQSQYLDPNGGEIWYNWTSGALYPTDFTIEAWGYLTAYGASGKCIITTSTVSVLSCRIQVGPTGELDFTVGGGTVTSGAGAVTLNAWHHLAAVKIAGNLFGYVDGIRITGPSVFSNDPGTPATIRVGDATSGLAQWVGKIGPCRVTAAARYSGASFPPITSLPTYP